MIKVFYIGEMMEANDKIWKEHEVLFPISVFEVAEVEE